MILWEDERNNTDHNTQPTIGKGKIYLYIQWTFDYEGNCFKQINTILQNKEIAW